jgi:hypothetical protein
VLFRSDGIRAALAAGHLVSLGTPWYASWDYPNAEGIVPADYSRVVGGHAYLAYGYDTDKQLVYCQNSWGVAWGKSGRFAVPFSSFEAHKKYGGYDAHYINVCWGVVEPEPEPEPDPEPDPVPEPDDWRKNLKWVALAVGIVLAVMGLMRLCG